MPRDARNADLERAIVDNPDDLESYLVYADWLIEHGDPRGELITTQVATERGDAGAVRRDREQAERRWHSRAQGDLTRGHRLIGTWRAHR